MSTFLSRVQPVAPTSPLERTIVLLIGAVQFVNVLDFVMVMPMGPDFAAALQISPSKLGLIGAAYTGAAAISGVAASFFLDRLGRRRALGLALVGLAMGTAASGLATGLSSLLLARAVAGAFGGPATSIAFSIIADVVPSERRGKAMGAVMAAFSVASVLGLPAGLELARVGGWRLPFFLVAALGLLIAAAAYRLLPPLRAHLVSSDAPSLSIVQLLKRREVLLSYAVTAFVMASSFLLFPNLSPFVQYNLGFPRKRLSSLYLIGGVVSFFATRSAGRLIDRLGSFVVGSVGTVVLIAVVTTFVVIPGPLPVTLEFSLFMLGNAVRNVAFSTLTSKVPLAGARARFMSIQSAIQHAAAAGGAFLGAHMLSDGGSSRLVGMERVGLLALALSSVVPPLLYALERRSRVTKCLMG